MTPTWALRQEVGMDEYQVRTGEGWHHHMVLSLLSLWFLIGKTHRGQLLTPALTLPQVRYGLSRLLMEVYCAPSIDDICRHVQRQLMRNKAARFYYHRTRKCHHHVCCAETYSRSTERTCSLRSSASTACRICP
jgi:hypothetical protein